MSSGGGAAGTGRGRDADMASALVNEMIKSIREITRELTGKQHGDEDIYTVLKDCAMDPNETASKLMYLDTFHEVKKKKKDRKKEVSNTQDRGARGGRGSYSANYNYSDGFCVKNAGPHRENGVYDISKRGNSSSSRATQKKNNPEGSSGTKASIATPNGYSSVTNGTSTPGHGPRLHADGVVNANIESSAADVKRQDTATVLSTATRPTFDSVVRGGVEGKSMPASNGFHVPSASGVPTTMHSAAPHHVSCLTFDAVVHGAKGKPTSSSNGFPSCNTPASAPGVCSSASDPILAPSNTLHPDAVGTIKPKVGTQRKTDEQHQGNRSVFLDVGSELTNNEKSVAMTVNSIHQKEVSSKPGATEDNSSLPESPQLAALPAHDGALASRLTDNQSPSELVIPSQAIAPSEDEKAKASPQSLPEPTILNGYVTFPRHLLVPNALKSGLSFGSFDASPGLKYSIGNGGEVDATHTIKPLQGTDETTREPYYSNENGSLMVQVDHSDEPKSPHQVHENVPQLEVDVAANADLKADESKETLLLPESHQYPHVQMAPNYAFELMPSLQGGHFVHLEKQDTHTPDDSHMSSYATEAPAASSSPIPTPSLQNSVAPPQQVLFRSPYHPSYLQYGPYFSPYFFHPMPQFLPNGISQQPSNGNTYIASSAPPKFPIPQFKHGTTAGNPPPVHSYGSYSSSSIGFNPSSAMASVNSTGNEDMPVSQSKESHHVYTTAALSEAFPQQGQDMTSLQLNSMYAQHLTFSPQAGHAAFSGLYSPVHTMADPSAINQHLQQSQAMSAANENVGHPPGAYQQPQPPPANWSLKYQ